MKKKVYAGYMNYYLHNQPGVLKTYYFHNYPSEQAVLLKEIALRRSSHSFAGSLYYEREFNDRQLW